MKRPNDGFGVGVPGTTEDADDEDMYMMPPNGICFGDKKRRLSEAQVRALERSFEAESGKLERERKARLARQLGLELSQVSVWFQNRRARCKTKQLERDHAALRRSYDALQADRDALRRHRDALLDEIKELKVKLGDAASDVEAPVPVTGFAMAASASPSGVVNNAEAAAMATATEKPPPAVTTEELEVQHVEHLLNVEDDEAAFLGDDDAGCEGLFFDLADLQLSPASLKWWTEPTEDWA